MRPEDLREATRKAAEQAEPRFKTRLSPGEKSQRKRMATVALIYTVALYVRSPESMMSPNQDDQAPRPQVENKRVWPSVEREPQTVIDELFDETLRRDPDRQQQWVVLVDGDHYQFARIQAAANRCQVSVIVVIDFIHVLEDL